MAAAYTARIAALATGVSSKWLDNLLSHHTLPGVLGGRQGIQRSISLPGILAIEVVRLAVTDLGMSVSRAVAAATELLANGDSVSQTLRTAAGIKIEFPLAEIERSMRERLVEAVEAAPNPPRGRPRTRRNRDG